MVAYSCCKYTFCLWILPAGNFRKYFWKSSHVRYSFNINNYNGFITIHSCFILPAYYRY